MKVESINRKVGGAFLLGFALLVIVPAQQHRINLAKRNEQSAARMLVRYTMENVELRMKLSRRGE